MNVPSKVFYRTVCCLLLCCFAFIMHMSFAFCNSQRSFQLEDANDIEIRQLKEKVASMTTESQAATAKVQQQDEQSEEEQTCAV